VSSASAPPLSYIQDFCHSFDPFQAHYAPDRGTFSFAFAYSFVISLKLDPVTMLARGIVSLAEAAGSVREFVHPVDYPA
jgi:hypothetical protein